jgi:hypothetical protein
MAAQDGTNGSTNAQSQANDPDVERLIGPSLFRLTEGIPRRELRSMAMEAKACEEALEREIQELEEALKNETATTTTTTTTTTTDKKESPPNEVQAAAASNNKSAVDSMLESEITPPDRYFAVSALLGRLRDDLHPPLPPNSTLPALRAQAGLQLQPPTKKKARTSTTSTPTNETTAPVHVELADLDKQKRLLDLDLLEEYRRPHETSAALLTVWKKISSHRTSAVFRRPVNAKEAPGYTDRIIFPMDLALVRKMIVAQIIKSYAELHQRIGLICHNCMKYNGRRSDYGHVTREFEQTVDEHILAAVGAAAATAATAAISSTTTTVETPAPAATSTTTAPPDTATTAPPATAPPAPAVATTTAPVPAAAATTVAAATAATIAAAAATTDETASAVQP